MEKVPINFVLGPIALDPKATSHRGVLYRKDLPPASAKYNKKFYGEVLVFTCPCGCGGIRVKPLKPEDWDENHEAPTLFQELAFDPCGWQGELKAGVFVMR